MMEMINGYLLEEPLKTDNSGFSRWGFAKHEDREYFIKEFLSPVYPVDEELLGAELTRKKKDICSDFVERKCRIFRSINNASDGNLARIEQFFRYGSKYYIIMERINEVELTRVLALPMEEKKRICMILAHAVAGMHREGLVHGDIKLSNIVFCENESGRIGARIIDLDSSFWEVQPPENEEDIFGDQVYMAPETFYKIAMEKGTLTRKIDVFALGILFHQILTGTAPEFDTKNFYYPYEAVLVDDALEINSRLPSELSEIIKAMLQKKPEDRPELTEVYETLQRSYRCLARGPVVQQDTRIRQNDFFFRAGEQDL
jgi:serine/threonine protein kinase